MTQAFNYLVHFILLLQPPLILCKTQSKKWGPENNPVLQEISSIARSYTGVVVIQVGLMMQEGARYQRRM